MSIILGFGSVEARVREEIKKLIFKTCKNINDITTLSNEWNSKGNSFDVMPREESPERYTKFYVYEGKIHYHHINRQHPFSHDGWAMLIVEEEFSIPTD